MAITTLAKVKTITGIDNDDLVEALIPLVEEDYKSIRNKPFDTGQGLKVTSPATSAGYIEITIDEITHSIHISSGDNVFGVARKIYDKLKYEYNLDLNADEVIFLTPHQVSYEDTDDTGVEVDSPTVAVIYPPGSESTAIRMVAYRVANRVSEGVKSESLGDHSVTYEDTSGSYPKGITAGIKRYVSFK